MRVTPPRQRSGEPAQPVRYLVTTVEKEGSAEQRDGGSLATSSFGAKLGEHSDGEFVSALWNHAAVMREVILHEGRPWPELSGADLRNLKAYLDEQAATD